MAGINARQESIGLSIPSNGVIVVGCGGVGSWVAYLLALAGVEQIWLFDPDVLEIHNLNRIPLPEASVGQRKSVAVAALIRSLRPSCTVLHLGTFTPKMADALNCGRADWLICTTDTHRSRQMSSGWATTHNVQYVEAGAEGDQGSATGQPGDWETPRETEPGYASVPVWVGPSVVSAYIAVAHVLHNVDMGDRTIRLGFEADEGGQKTFRVFDTEMSLALDRAYDSGRQAGLKEARAEYEVAGAQGGPSQ